MKFPVTPWRKRHDREFDEELEGHFAFEVEQRVQAGETREAAEAGARRDFGNVTRVKEVTREVWGWGSLERFLQEIKYAVRRLRAAPGFTLAAILTIALCLGANLAIFGVIEAILIRSLPFPDAGRLVSIYNTYPKAAVLRDGSSITNYYERRGAIAAFRSVSIYQLGRANVGGAGASVRRPVVRVSPEFFATLGREPVIGRSFSDLEMTYQTDNVAIITSEYWKEHLQSDPRVIGKTVWVDTYPKTVVGVLPAGFRFLSSKADLYLPLSSRLEDRTPLQRHSGGNVTQMIARLSPGVRVEQAQAQIDGQNTALERDDPQAKMMADAGFRSVVLSLHSDQVAEVRPLLLSLEAGVLALLLIGTVNLVNLFLIRANGRAKELAVRQALGAGKGRVLSAVLIESTVLGLLGGTAALAVGAAGIRLLTQLGAQQLPLGDAIRFDGGVAAVALIGAVALGFVLALPVALFHLRPDPSLALRSESRSATGSRAMQALRHGFVVAQIGLGLVLLVGSGLLGVSLKRAMEVSPGFAAEHAVAGQISLVGRRYPSTEAGLAFTERLEADLRREVGVVAVGIATNIPFSGRNGKSAATAEGHVLRPGESPRGYYSYGVAGDFFQALGFSLRSGRFLTTEDSRRGQRVCVVDEDFARYNWPHGNAVGQLIFQGADLGKESEAFRVVGVVGSIKQAGVTDDTAQGAVYYPYIYQADNNIFVVERGNAGNQTLQANLQRVVKEIDPELSVNDLMSMDDRIAASLLDQRSATVLSGIFSVLALLLVGIGTYGVLSYAVTQRKREIAVRLAIGARPEQISREVFALTLKLLAVGGVLGMAGAWMAGRELQTLLFHVPGNHLEFLGAGLATIAALALAASFLPARRAARVSPMQALSDQ